MSATGREVELCQVYVVLLCDHSCQLTQQLPTCLESLMWCELSPHILSWCSSSQKGGLQETGWEHLWSGACGFGAAFPPLPLSFPAISVLLPHSVGRSASGEGVWTLSETSASLGKVQGMAGPQTKS